MTALRYAEKLVTETQAELVLAHAFGRPASWDHDGQLHPESKALEDRVQQVACSVPCERILHAGPPGEVICWLAQENDCDLIVMGTHGRSGLKHLLFGSTAEYVLQHARCPVLTIRERPENEPPLSEPIVLPLPGPGA
jgi:nucleotide-binding universal stress UspA family protein